MLTKLEISSLWQIQFRHAPSRWPGFFPVC